MDQEAPASTTPETKVVAPTSLAPSTPVHKKSWLMWGLLALGIVVLGAGGGWYVTSFSKTPTTKLATYFTYTAEEMSSLKGLSSAERLSVDDLYRWDQNAFDTAAREQTLDVGGDAAKLNAYLAVAERDFAYLAYNISGQFEGNFDQLSKDIVCSFFKKYCSGIVVQGTQDAFSVALSAIVMKKVTARMAEDQAGLKDYEIKSGAEYWDGIQPSAGLNAGSSLGWFITSGAQFRAPPPPAFDSEEFKKQVATTKEFLAKATAEQKRATVFWAGVPGTKTPPGQILQLGDVYMQEKSVPLQKALLVRSVLAMAVADAVTAVFDSKYTYWVRRPFMMDPSIKSIMPTPNHPSYAAGHSTLSAAGTTVLKHYFPEDTTMWDAKAYEAGMSRVWGGIHYVMDHEAGVAIGKSVGTVAVEAPSSK
ncbi:MAG: phosphatase PAP2 family protein [Patescibacteria group bacterium]